MSIGIQKPTPTTATEDDSKRISSITVTTEQMVDLELSVLMPCLNEERTLPSCIAKIWNAMRENGIQGEIIVADNGSTDRSREVAENLGARVTLVSDKGYGAALLAE